MNDKKVYKSRATPRERSISVLLPALNEENNLRPTVERLQLALNITMDDFEFIIVNDGSTDKTKEVAELLASQFDNIIVEHNLTCRGLGYVYAQAAQLATKNYFVYIPSDNTWPYRSFVELFGNLGKSDIITSFSSNPGVRPFSRRIVSKSFTYIMNKLFNLNMNYFNGLTIYPMEFLRTKPVTTFGFGFQSEVLIKALKLGYSFIEIGLPIDERTAGKSKAVNIRNITSVLQTIVRLYWDINYNEKYKYSVNSKRNEFNFISLNVSIPHSNFSIDEMGLKSREIDRQINTIHPDKLVIVIAGGSSGIGAELTRKLYADGHKLIICSRNTDKLAEVTSFGKLALYKSCDVSDEGQVKEFLKFVQSNVGHVDVLINCAGKFGAIGSIASTDSQEWFETIRVNLFGTYLMTKTLLPLLKLSTMPQVINFSGGGAFNPFPNFSAYACSKAAVIRLTETLAIELAPDGIRVNAVAPGRIATPAHEAILAAGEDLVGASHFRKTKSLMNEGGVSMAKVIDCIRFMMTQKMSSLTGKTISANFDPWDTASFQDNVLDITKSDLYTMCRMNIVNLPEGNLKSRLSAAWAKHHVKM